MGFQSESTPIARKHHRCCECGGHIKVGEKYIRSSGVWEGDFYSYKFCPICNEIYGIIFSRMDACERAEGIQQGDIHEWIESYGDYQELLKKYTDNMAARGVTVPDWMLRRLFTSSTPSSN